MLLVTVNLSDEPFNNIIDFRLPKMAFSMRTFGQVLKHRNYSTEYKEYISLRGFIYLQL